jgi:exosortase/archaeosortase family protein
LVPGTFINFEIQIPIYPGQYMKGLLEKYYKQPSGVRFLINGSLLVVAYKLFAVSVAAVYVNVPLTRGVLESSAWVLNVVGCDCQEATVNSNILEVDGMQSVSVAGSCNGLSVILLFAAFIILTQGRWWMKIVFIVGGTALLGSLNVLRVSSLAYSYVYHGITTFDFNHKYLYQSLTYLVVFALWILWLRINPRKPMVA